MCDHILHDIEAAIYPYLKDLSIMQKVLLIEACVRDCKLTPQELLAKQYGSLLHPAAPASSSCYHHRSYMGDTVHDLIMECHSCKGKSFAIYWDEYQYSVQCLSCHLTSWLLPEGPKWLT